MLGPVASSPTVFLLPVLDDWAAFAVLCHRLDAVCAAHSIDARVIAVDDGSTTSCPPFADGAHPTLRSVEVLVLRRNVGHQRAIALGLAFIHAERPCDAVVIMDADGEDRPEDAPTLIARSRAGAGRLTVFAKRRRRLESVGFRVCYRVYQVFHRWLTGITVEVGNFSVVPASRLPALVSMPELWNHYAAAVFKSRIPFESVPLDRDRRLSGRSKMRFVDLVVHGLSAISVFSEIVAVRTLVAIGVAAVALFAGLWIAQPAWTLTGLVILTVILLQVLGIVTTFIFFVLRARSELGFLAVRDYGYFIAGVETLGVASRA